MDKFQQKYLIPTARLQSWDYGSPGLYFVTICTKHRELYCGDIVSTPHINHPTNVETQDIASPFAAPVPDTQNTDTNKKAPNVETQNFASLRTVIGNIADEYWLKIPEHFPFVELDEYVVMPNHVHGILFLNKPDHKDWQPNKFGPQSKNLGSVIRGYKAGVKTFATTNQIDFGWQPRFHDRVIRSEKELNNIRHYIISNPAKWHLDKNNPENLLM